MPSVSEQIKGNPTSATPHEIVETDKDNINLSRDQFEAKYRKKREIKAKLELERIRLEELARQEEEDLIKAGQEDAKAKEVKPQTTVNKPIVEELQTEETNANTEEV